MDNILWIIKYQEYNSHYNAYGLDIKGALHSEYLANRSYVLSQRKIIKNSKQVKLTNDKLIFFRYMKACGIPTPAVFAVIIDGKILDLNFQPVDMETLKERKNYFIKPIRGSLGSGIEQIHDFEEYCKSKENFMKGRFIVQESVTQHSEMNKLNPKSVNTLRLVTIMDKNGEVSLFSRLLRIGTSKSGYVDNWAKGSLIVGITKDGGLKKYGFYQPGFGTKEQMHPDSKIEFETFKIPYYSQAEEAVIRAHKFFYDMYSVGWDVAITENGCVIIEGNNLWNINGFQTANCGLKKKWHDAVKMYQA